MSEMLVLEAPWLIIFTFTFSCPKTLKTCITSLNCLTSHYGHLLHGAMCCRMSPAFTCSTMLQQIMHAMASPALMATLCGMHGHTSLGLHKRSILSSQGRIGARTRSRMRDVLATLQIREMMDTLCVQETLAKSPNADVSDSISSSIRSRSQILLHE